MRPFQHKDDTYDEKRDIYLMVGRLDRCDKCQNQVFFDEPNTWCCCKCLTHTEKTFDEKQNWEALGGIVPAVLKLVRETVKSEICKIEKSSVCPSHINNVPHKVTFILNSLDCIFCAYDKSLDEKKKSE